MAEYGRTKKQFGQAAEAYTASAIFSDGEDLRWLVEAAAPRSDEDALDVGTAAGYTAFALAPLVRRVVGIDVTPAMVEAARRNAGQSGLANFTAEVANAEELPFPDGSFDIVACRYTAHHFRRPKVAVGEMARTLRPGGRLVVVDNTAPENGELDQWINHVERLRDPSHVKEWSEGEWEGFCHAAGLDFRVVRTWTLPLEFDDWVARSKTPPDRVAELRSLLAGAGPAQKEAFAITDGRFGLVTRLMVGVKPGVEPGVKRAGA